MHWHGDTFSLPDGAVRLARNDAYENQAFRVGPCAYGLQFHVEVTASLVAHWGPHLPAGVFVRASDVAHVARARRRHRAPSRRAVRTADVLTGVRAEL